nr:unnamed protein product [Digitaria exilis]
MARVLLASSTGAAGSAASAALGSSWFFGLCLVVVSVWVVSFAVFICGHSSRVKDDLPRKKPAPAATAKKPAAAAPSSGTARSSSRTVPDYTGMYTAALPAYVGGATYAASAYGCSGGHGGGGGCGGGGGGGGGGCGGGGGGGC